MVILSGLELVYIIYVPDIRALILLRYGALYALKLNFRQTAKYIVGIHICEPFYLPKMFNSVVNFVIQHLLPDR